MKIVELHTDEGNTRSTDGHIVRSCPISLVLVDFFSVKVQNQVKIIEIGMAEKIIQNRKDF